MKNRLMRGLLALAATIALTVGISTPAQAFSSFRVDYSCGYPAKARIWINNTSGATVNWSVYKSNGQFVSQSSAAAGQAKWYYYNVSGTGYAWVWGTGASRPSMQYGCW